MVKWKNPGNGVAPSLHPRVVAIEKGAFGSPLTKVTNSFLLTSKKHTLPLLRNRDWKTVNAETEKNKRIIN